MSSCDGVKRALSYPQWSNAIPWKIQKRLPYRPYVRTGRSIFSTPLILGYSLPLSAVRHVLDPAHQSRGGTHSWDGKAVDPLLSHPGTRSACHPVSIPSCCLESPISNSPVSHHTSSCGTRNAMSRAFPQLTGHDGRGSGLASPRLVENCGKSDAKSQASQSRASLERAVSQSPSRHGTEHKQ